MKIAFYSTMNGVPWGGSETLWSCAAERLLSRGDRVTINYPRWSERPAALKRLVELGASLHERHNPSPQGFINKARQLLQARANSATRWLQSERPHLLVITLAFHLDRVPLVDFCLENRIPYVLQLQCAAAHRFTPESYRKEMAEAYRNAAQVLIVSEENLEKVESNLGTRLSNVEQIDNPFSVPWETPYSWHESDRLKLACVGRIHFASKGQDLIVHALKRSSWKDRAIEVTLYGHDQGDRARLESLIDAYGLREKIRWGGFQNDLVKLWSEHHALLLPSRFEGSALVVTEAMLAHRGVIATDTGRNREWIQDSINGLLIASPTSAAVDEALQRAWILRDQWQTIGRRAGSDIRARITPDPVSDFVQRLTQLASAH